MRLKDAICILTFGILTAACVNRPKGVLSDKKMAPVVADMELAEAYIESLPTTKAKNSREEVVEYVITKHGLTREQFDSTMSWYGHNTDAYFEMLDLADKELLKRKGKIAGASTIEIESSDLWPYQRMSMISELGGTSAFDFTIPTADVQKGQRLNLRFRSNNSTSGNVLLGVEYDNGSLGYLNRNIRESKRIDLTLQTDTSKAVSRIFGHFLISDNHRLPLWLDSISLQALPFDSMEYYKIRSQRLTNYK